MPTFDSCCRHWVCGSPSSLSLDAAGNSPVLGHQHELRSVMLLPAFHVMMTEENILFDALAGQTEREWEFLNG